MKAVVIAAAALHPLGHDWRGLGAAVLRGPRAAGRVPDGAGSVDPRQRKLMSRAAELAALTLRRVLDAAAWRDGRAAIGAYLGVGASGGALDDIDALLAASREGDSLSLARLGREGLAACTPLLAFQLMNNFTLCHGAILEGVGGPNAAFFSRGAGTTLALTEAIAALAAGDCDRAVAGAADTALHPVTLAELRREGHAGAADTASEAAALLALTRDGPGLATVTTRRGSAGADVVLRLDDVAAALGQSLAATPALAWCAALDLVGTGARRVAVIGTAPDGDAGVVTFEGEAHP